MTKDEALTLTLAREAGVEVTYDPTETPLRAFAECWIEDLERFADLVTEQANARANTSWALMCKKMVAFEREACAKVVEASPSYDWHRAGEAAAAIRARGNT